MASFNRVILVGNLCRDPQTKFTTGGTAICELSLAVNRQWVDKATNQKKDEVTFVEVTLWGRTAEIAGQYLAKGRPVLIEGRLTLDQWDDKETGQKRSKLKVTGESMTMLGNGQGGGRPSGGDSGSGGESSGDQSSGGTGEFSEPTGGGDDIPF